MHLFKCCIETEGINYVKHGNRYYAEMELRILFYLQSRITVAADSQLVIGIRLDRYDNPQFTTACSQRAGTSYVHTH